MKNNPQNKTLPNQWTQSDKNGVLWKGVCVNGKIVTLMIL